MCARCLLCFVFLLGLATPANSQTFRDASDLLRGSVITGFRGVGASAVDVNSDGWTDIYTFDHLYLNHAGDFFQNEHTEAGLTDEGTAVFGGVFGDYDNDSFLDLLIEDLTPPSFLYHNRGDAFFTRSNTQTGILAAQPLTQGAAWADFNTDGKLDLFIGSDDGFNRLYENLDYHTFADRTGTANVQKPRNSYGVAVSDYDRDGDFDIFIASCSSLASRSVKVLLQNQGNMRFEDINSPAGVHDDLASWGVVWFDYDNDGWQDLYVANMPIATDRRPGFNTLYWNGQEGRFFDLALNAGVKGEELEDSFGVAAADFDNDGWQDLYVANGQAEDRLYRNNGDGTFTDILPDTNIGSTGGMGVAVGDFNNDGWVDLFLAVTEKLLLNDGGTNHWLKVHTRGTASNHYGVGARVEAFIDGQIQLREITAGDGMTSQNHNLSAHFGLGTATMIDSLVIRWPSGQVDRIENVAADQTITVVEGDGIDQAPSSFRLLTPADDAVSASNDTQLTFTWEAPDDADSPVLQYTFRLYGPETELVVAGLSAPTYTLDPSSLPLNATYTWSVSATDGHTVRSSVDRFALSRVVATASELPDDMAPLQLHTYPNPFTETATVQFHLPRPSDARVEIYNVRGQRIRTLLHHALPTGTHTAAWDGRTDQGSVAAPGVYLLHITASGHERTQTVLKL